MMYLSFTSPQSSHNNSQIVCAGDRRNADAVGNGEGNKGTKDGTEVSIPNDVSLLYFTSIVL